MPKARTLILGTALVLFGAAPVSAAELAGTEWGPVQVGDIRWPEGSEAFIGFEADGQVKGHGGCNAFLGSYQVTGDTIEVDIFIPTDRFCSEPGVMDREELVLETLKNARGIERDGPRLTLTDEAGHPIGVFLQDDQMGDR